MAQDDAATSDHHHHAGVTQQLSNTINNLAPAAAVDSRT